MRPVALDIGFYVIHWYGVMMAIAVLVAIGVMYRLAKPAGRTFTFASDLGCWAVVWGVVGARLAHVLNYPDEYRGDPIGVLRVYQGGLVYYGGLIGATIGVFVFALRRKERVLWIFDLIVTALPLSHAIGRVGCFLEGCCYGLPSTGRLAVRFPLNSLPGWDQYWGAGVTNDVARTLMTGLAERRITAQEFGTRLDLALRDGLIGHADASCVPLHPVQLYEAGLNVILFVGLVRLFLRTRRSGLVLAVYAMGYGSIRFATEWLRGDARPMFGPVSSGQIISAFLVLAGVVAFWLVSRRHGNTADNSAA